MAHSAVARICGTPGPVLSEPSSPRRTLSRMSTAAPSAKRGTVNSASSRAVRSRSRVVPMRELAEFSQARRLRVVNRSGGRTPLLRRNRTFAPAERCPAEPRPGRRRLPLPHVHSSASKQNSTPLGAQCAPETASAPPDPRTGITCPGLCPGARSRPYWSGFRIPYWDTWGAGIEGPDGCRLVLSTRSRTNSDLRKNSTVLPLGRTWKNKLSGQVRRLR